MSLRILKSNIQVVHFLSRIASKDVVVLPKSVTPARIKSNKSPIALSPEDLELLDKLAGEGGKQSRFIKPNWGKKVSIKTFSI